jgi:hypothetical protein
MDAYPSIISSKGADVSLYGYLLHHRPGWACCVFTCRQVTGEGAIIGDGKRRLRPGCDMHLGITRLPDYCSTDVTELADLDLSAHRVRFWAQDCIASVRRCRIMSQPAPGTSWNQLVLQETTPSNAGSKRHEAGCTKRPIVYRLPTSYFTH